MTAKRFLWRQTRKNDITIFGFLFLYKIPDFTTRLVPWPGDKNSPDGSCTYFRSHQNFKPKYHFPSRCPTFVCKAGPCTRDPCEESLFTSKLEPLYLKGLIHEHLRYQSSSKTSQVTSELHDLIYFLKVDFYFWISCKLENFYRPVSGPVWSWNLQFCLKIGIQKQRCHFAYVTSWLTWTRHFRIFFRTFWPFLALLTRVLYVLRPGWNQANS